ncbi:hypothetical protein YC2023_084562 [Brassica napus]
MLRFRNHPRIVQTTNPNLHIGINLDHCYIYMELASKGTLHNFISSFSGQPVPEVMIRRAALMILQGLEALHSHGYVHCDLKPANVLLFPSKIVGEPWDLKLADFGLSKEPSCTNPRSLSGGTKEYMPPECLESSEDGRMLLQVEASETSISAGQRLLEAVHGVAPLTQSHRSGSAETSFCLHQGYIICFKDKEETDDDGSKT